MREAFKPAIDALEADLADLERQAFETKQVINRLCVRAGIDPLYPDATLAASASIGTLRSDSFYGKGITTAAREFLEMRRAAGLGPASPREVYEALVKGGYAFETAEDVHGVISVRGTLRKSSGVFHRLPNGLYGLLEWYPKAKAVRNESENDAEPRRPRRAKRSDANATPRNIQPRKSPKLKIKKAQKEQIRPSVTPFVLKAMANGSEWTTESLKHEAITHSLPGVNELTRRSVFHGALMGLKKTGRVEQTGADGWRIVRKTAQQHVGGNLGAA
jgi:hypothetical protein